MKSFKIKILTVVGGLLLLFSASCKKWVSDTSEPLQVDESLVFSTEKGFQDVLTGVYLQMGDSTLYGRDLSMGVLSLLGRSYDQNIETSIGPLFYESARYNLQGADLKKYAAEVWIKMYQSIANLNNLLVNIEAKKSIFTGNNYNRYKGETLALRAYLHFDLLRLFTMAPAAGTSSGPGIPYIKTISPGKAAISTIDEVMGMCIEDLKTAESLLSPTDVTNYRINNWAVKGMLARLYLYKGDHENAKLCANSVIESNKFLLAKTNADLFFTNENLFNLFLYQSQSFQKSVFADQAKLGLTAVNQTELYVKVNGAVADWRKSFVDPTTGNGTGAPFMPKKFYPFASKPSMPMVRLTEMYYIAAECALKDVDAVKATALLDTVRVHRNLPKYPIAGLTLENLGIEIKNEYQKEFIAEGQMFFYYKRKNMPFATLPFTKVPVDGNASYLFVKPE
ncbi:RagB/SusD family nutrient uptake outer membrane protein [Pedobacter nyackensis]|uniref:SusD family protein n=1 Tax=Pedobacter nyackensis TaxID=475255 RepID=A0A1W2CQ89_9SPHI|nr:RagB/SusD family nutrient uptake outer membrane protein [Pedobacter nyackensis]SMC87425.1 SusD family protein [Pedobacter nyackensis]